MLRVVRQEKDDGVEQLSRRVADNLRTIRAARGFTLDELASRCGVSRGTLSQIETCRTNPTLAVLWKIASGLEVPFSTLLGEEDAPEAIRVVNIGAQNAIRSADGMLESRPLTPGRPLGNVDLYELTLEPGGVHRSEAHAAGTIECLTVLEGEIRVIAGENVAEAGPRCALFFAADVEHAYENPGRHRVRALNVIIYGRAASA
jgi:XRE family transcriptional regulator, regulator of sulfur utilization